MKKILTELMHFSFVIVPVSLVVWGIMNHSEPVTDVVMILLSVAFLMFAGKMSRKVWQGKAKAEQVATPVAGIGAMMAFFALSFQIVYCHLRGNALMPFEGAMTWMFLLIACYGFRVLFADPPRLMAVSIACFCGMIFLSLCAVGGMFDLFEYFTEREIPQQLGDFFGVIATLSVIGCIVCLIIGIIQERIFKR